MKFFAVTFLFLASAPGFARDYIPAHSLHSPRMEDCNARRETWQKRANSIESICGQADKAARTQAINFFCGSKAKELANLRDQSLDFYTNCPATDIVGTLERPLYDGDARHTRNETIALTTDTFRLCGDQNPFAQKLKEESERELAELQILKSHVSAGRMRIREPDRKTFFLGTLDGYIQTVEANYCIGLLYSR